ncbi:MAG: 50S ribosomal protein L9 [Spirochaetota bacterium]
MKVILNQDIPNLGEEGDIKDVARGYARNYLIPKKFVMPYTNEALARLENRRETIEARRAEKRQAATDIKTRLEQEPLVIEMPAGDRGRLFGSVTSATVAEALASNGIEVERRRIDIPEKTIKTVGTTYVRVRLYGDQEAELRVDVKPVGGAAAEAAAAEAAAAIDEAAASDEAAATSDDEAAATAAAESEATATATATEEATAGDEEE